MRRGVGGIPTGLPPLHSCASLVSDVREALIWASKRPVQLAMLEREEITQQIEEAGRQQVKMGHAEAWYHQADAVVRAVAGKANGMLLQMLLKASLFVDTDFPNPLREGSLLRGAVVSHTFGCFFTSGADLLDGLPCSGVGVPINLDQRVHNPADELWWDCEESNIKLIGGSSVA